MKEVRPRTAGRAKVDGIHLEIMRHKILAVAREMAVHLQNTAQIAEINQERDFGVGIVDRSASVVALDNPVQLGAFTESARYALSYFKFDMRDGDVILCSDPERGGTRVVDLTLIKPYFHDNAALLYVVARARIPDLGGASAGGIVPEATEVWGEGVPISPIKVHRGGRPVRDLLTTVLLNSRQPAALNQTLATMIAALALGSSRIDELIRKDGVEEVRRALAYSQEYVERRARAAIQQWRKGTFSASSTLDNDGTGRAATVRVSVRVDDDSASFDFGESDEQRMSFVNCTLGTTIGAAVLPVLALLGNELPANGGLLAAIRVGCASGRITNVRGKLPTGWSTVHCAAEITEAVGRALRQTAETSFGALTAPVTLLACRPNCDRGARIDLGILGVPGGSATSAGDGWGRPPVHSRSVYPSIEQWELTKGVAVKSIEFVADTAGAGAHRGAPATETVLALPPGQVYSICMEGYARPAVGAEGGGSGSAAELSIVDEAGSTHRASHVQTELALAGRMVTLRSCGGAGFGPASRRKPEAVLDDVRDGLVSPECAKRLYAVQVTEDGRDIDRIATGRLRQKEASGHG